MSEWKQKRFWTAADVEQRDALHTVVLDGRPVKTPAKSEFLLPNAALARAIAAEWDAQDETVDPTSMPLTRTANSVIDKVTPHREDVAAMIAEYGNSDLICYRATDPEELVRRQAEAWDPLLNWAEAHLQAPLLKTEGVVHIAQPEASLSVLADRVAKLDPWTLSGFHDLVSLSGSLILGFATLYGHRDPEQAWQISRIDEVWQEEQWGADELASAAASHKRQAFLVAHKFTLLCKP